MMGKNKTTIKVDEDVSRELTRLQREIELAQDADVTKGELVKRTLRIPGVQDILKQDAIVKRRLGIK